MEDVASAAVIAIPLPRRPRMPRTSAAAPHWRLCLVVGLAVLGALLTAGPAAAGGAFKANHFGPASFNPNPFGHRLEPHGTSDERGFAPTLPRLAQAEPAPAGTPPNSATSSHGPPAAPRISCFSDTDCPDESFCEKGACRRIEQRVNVFFLYYREGAFREILGLYWSKRGATGFTVVAPIYWNYWAPTSRSRIVAPFYWHFEDDAAHSMTTVIVPGLPISWSRQPGARSFGVWPLLYVSTKFGWAAPLLGSFKIADPDRGRALGAFAFLYWWQRTPAGAFDLGFPLFVSSRSPASAFTFALPLNFYWRSGVDAHTLAIPFFYRQTGKDTSSTYSLLGYHDRAGPQSDGAILWLYWFGRDRARNRAHDVLFPLLWSFRSKNSGVSILFPLVWDFKERDARTTVVGPVVHLREGRGWMNAVVPLWWSGGNSDAGWRFQMLLPLFFWKTAAHGARFSWVAPIGGYSRDSQAGSRSLALLPGLFFRRDPNSEIDVVAPLFVPLFIRHHNIEADSTTRLSLLLYLRDDPRGSTSVLFPIFWRFKDRPTGATATAVFPLFFHRSGPRDSTTFVGPVYWRSLADGGWGAGVFPVAFFGQRGDTSHAVVFPLLWRFVSARSRTTLLLPLFFKTQDASGRDAGILPLLTFFGQHGDASYQVQFPLFWRFADERAHTATAVTPLGFYGQGPDGWRAGLLTPLLWARGGGPQRHFVLFPLVWHFADDSRDESTTVAALYWHRRRGGETTDAFFPIVHYRRGARPGGDDQTSLTVLPFFHYRRDAHVRLLLTLVGGAVTGPRRAAGFVGPYFWYRGPQISAAGIPFLYADVTRADTSERTRQFGPLFAIDAPDHTARIFVPFFGHYRDARETDTYVFPSYFRQRKTDGYAVDTFLPFYWQSVWRDRTTTIVGPWYRRHGTQVHNTGLVPLYFWAKNPDRTLLVIPPLLTFHRHDFRSDTATTWVGLFLKAHSPDSDRTVVFPFWWSGRTGERRHAVLGPFYWHFEDRAAAKSWTLITLLYGSTDHTQRTRALLPVAWYTRDDANQTGSEAVMPLFYASHGPNQFTLLTLLAGVSRSLEANRWYAGLLYVSNTVNSSTRVLFPLYVSHFDRASERRTRLFLPLAYFSRSTPEKSITTIAALFWRRTDIASATTLVLPLFFDVHDYRASRTTVLLPLFFRHANETTGHNYALAPLFYRHTSPGAATTVAFPLFWDFKDGDRRTTIVFPLFAHWTRATHAGTYVFPIFYYRTGYAAGAPPRTPDGTWRLFVPPLFDAAVQRPGDLRWEILGGLFGKERIGRNHYMKILFMTFETQKASAVQTSWYGQPRRPSRTHPARGLATNAW